MSDMEPNLKDWKPAGKKPDGSRGRRGFFVALAVCLAAVGVAAWSAYDGVSQYRDTAASTIQSVQPESTPVLMPTVSEAPASSAPVSSAPASSQQASSTQKKAASAAEKPAAAAVTKMSLPVKDAAVQLAFSETPLYSKTMQDWRAHTGVDFAVEKGASVLAAADGTVSDVSVQGVMGQTVQITHAGGLVTWYCGLDQKTVQKGDTVKAGDKIGTVGTVPGEAADASHLHFAVQKDGAFLDPTSYFQ